MPAHPRAKTANGYILEHVLVMEELLGLANDVGLMSLQVANVTPGADYIVSVLARTADPGNGLWESVIVVGGVLYLRTQRTERIGAAR